ncbi:MAG: MFS transporter [Alphaproteobacteria bacterium]
MLALLSNATFRALFTAQVIALVGTGLSTIGLALLAYALAGDKAGLVLGTALALKMVAYVAIAPVVGAFAHRLPRKALLVTLDLGRAVLVLCLPLVTEIWHIYLLIFLLNACSAAFTPTFQATIPDVLPDEDDYTRALSLSRLAYDLENLLSPLLAGAALLYLSYDALFSANAVAFAVSALLVTITVLPSPAPKEDVEGLWQKLSLGARVYLGTPRLRALLALSLAVAAGGAMVIVNTVVLVRGPFGGSESDVALAFAASGAGSMLAALLLPLVLDRLTDRSLMVAGGFMVAAGLFLGPFATGMVALLPVWFLLGAGSSCVQTPAGRLLRRSSDDVSRPALYATQFALSHACWLLAYPAAGWLVGATGIATTFTLLGLTALIASAAALVLWPSADPVEIAHRHETMDHRHLHIHGEHHLHEHEGWEGPEPHRHAHRHVPVRHSHRFVIDGHHPIWPGR